MTSPSDNEVAQQASHPLAAPTHDLKIRPDHFECVVDGTKRAEVRKHDRDFWVGDILRLREFEMLEYTGRVVHARITHILPGGHYGIDDNYAVLSIERVSDVA